VRTNVALIVLGLHAAALHAQQPPPPIIDMHLHAARASSNGPPPTALCLPFTEIPTHDPATSWAQGFGKQLKNPPCADPIWGPATDEAVLNETCPTRARSDRRRTRRRSLATVAAVLLGGAPVALVGG